MKQPPSLVCDVMLGRLARWLRILGVDTLYGRDWRDAELVGIAHREHRLLVTRNTKLAWLRDAPPLLLVEANDLFAQLVEVCRALDLIPGTACFSRCLACNAPLEEKPAALMNDRLFPHVRDTQERVRHCARCDRVYWAGTHPARMESTLARLRAVLGDAPAAQPSPAEKDEDQHE